MSLSEYDKRVLLQEIQQIQQTLDLEVNSKGLNTVDCLLYTSDAADD